MNNMQTEEKILQVPIEDIIPNRFQPRLAFDDASLNDLAASIKQHGIIQPLVLRRKNDKYEIIAGERRYKAARMAGLVSVPAIISNLSDQASAEVAVVENVQRKNLSAIEEAKSYQMLLEKGYMTQDELSKKMGISQSAISNKLRLLTLDESVQQAVIKEQISERHARSLLKIKDHEMQKVLLNKIITERLTVKQLEDEIKKIVGSNQVDATAVNISPSPTQPIENNENTLKAIHSINKLINEPNNQAEVSSPKTAPKPQDNNTSDDIPIIEDIPNIENIVNNAVDIKTLNQNTQGGTQMNQNVATNTPSSATFSESPEKAPNRFFNFLETQAANLSFEEPPQEVISLSEAEPSKPTDILNQTDNIEMLDDFIVPSTPTDNKVLNDDYLDHVIKTVRGLNFDSDKVVIEEMNLPTEYQITIKIKKDKL